MLSKMHIQQRMWLHRRRQGVIPRHETDILYFPHIGEYFYNQYIHESMKEHLQMCMKNKTTHLQVSN